MFQFAPIGVIRSCFRQKFGIPRQPRLVPAARATLELLPSYAQPEAVRGLEGFSHLWLLFVFHGIPAGHWQPTVRPPRLGGNQRMGVFATRSSFRPNPIGLSAVALERIEISAGRVVLHLAGVDVLDGTPVLDIKPYVPYADSIPEAVGGFANEAPGAVAGSGVQSGGGGVLRGLAEWRFARIDHANSAAGPASGLCAYRICGAALRDDAVSLRGVLGNAATGRVCNRNSRRPEPLIDADEDNFAEGFIGLIDVNQRFRPSLTGKSLCRCQREFFCF